MKNSVKMFKSAQKCTKFYKNSQKPSKTVPKFAVSRIWYLVSRWAGLKNKPNLLLLGEVRIAAALQASQ